MSDLLPCCKCGKSEGYELSEGSTYRWWAMSCKACGEEFGEVRADRAVNLRNEPIPKHWQYADEEWNDANKHAQGLRDRIAALEAIIDAAPHEPNCHLYNYGARKECSCWKSRAREQAQ